MREYLYKLSHPRRWPQQPAFSLSFPPCLPPILENHHVLARSILRRSQARSCFLCTQDVYPRLEGNPNLIVRAHILTSGVRFSQSFTRAVRQQSRSPVSLVRLRTR